MSLPLQGLRSEMHSSLREDCHQGFEIMLWDPEQTRVNWKRTKTKSSHNYHNCTISRKPFLKGHQWCPISLAQRAPGAAETRSERDEHGRADASLGGPDPTWTVAKLFFWPIAMSHQITIHHIKDKDHGAEMNSASCDIMCLPVDLQGISQTPASVLYGPHCFASRWPSLGLI
jgi:hypothetical protein